MALSSWPPWAGKVPDMGVRMGDEMLMPCTFFLRGERRADRMAEARDWVFSSLALVRLRLDGLFFSRLVSVDVELFSDGRRCCCWPAGTGASSLTPGLLGRLVLHHVAVHLLELLLRHPPVFCDDVLVDGGVDAERLVGRGLGRVDVEAAGLGLEARADGRRIREVARVALEDGAERGLRLVLGLGREGEGGQLGLAGLVGLVGGPQVLASALGEGEQREGDQHQGEGVRADDATNLGREIGGVADGAARERRTVGGRGSWAPVDVQRVAAVSLLGSVERRWGGVNVAQEKGSAQYRDKQRANASPHGSEAGRARVLVPGPGRESAGQREPGDVEPGEQGQELKHMLRAKDLCEMQSGQPGRGGDWVYSGW